MNQPSLPAVRRAALIFTSLVMAAVMWFIGSSKGLFRNPDTRVFEFAVFFAAWLAVVLIVNAFLKRVRDLNDLTMLGGFARRRQNVKRRP